MIDKLISRRGFLRSSLAGAAVATVSAARPAKAATFEGYPDSMGVIVDLVRCVGCRSCEAACNKEQKLPVPEKPFNTIFFSNDKPFENHNSCGIEKRLLSFFILRIRINNQPIVYSSP